MTWIKTKDQLPPDLTSVLLFFKDKHSKEVFVGYWDKQNKLFVNTAVLFLTRYDIDYDEELCFKKKNIKYWRELPCMPEKELDD